MEACELGDEVTFDISDSGFATDISSGKLTFLDRPLSDFAGKHLEQYETLSHREGTNSSTFDEF